MFALTISQTGLDDVIATLGRAQAFAADPITPVKQELIAWFRAMEARLFTSQGGSGQSGRWPSLSKRYASWKAVRYPGRTILERTGALRASLQTQTANSIIESTPRRLVLGTRVPYARFHQRGTERMPQRAPIDVTNRDAAEAMAIVRRKMFAAMAQGRKAAA